MDTILIVMITVIMILSGFMLYKSTYITHHIAGMWVDGDTTTPANAEKLHFNDRGELLHFIGTDDGKFYRWHTSPLTYFKHLLGSGCVPFKIETKGAGTGGLSPPADATAGLVPQHVYVQVDVYNGFLDVIKSDGTINKAKRFYRDSKYHDYKIKLADRGIGASQHGVDTNIEDWHKSSTH